MDDDAPDDVALRTLTPPAVRRPRPRSRHRRRARRPCARSPPPTSASSSPPTTAAGPRRSPSPVTSTTTTSWPRWRRRSPTCRPATGASPARAPDGAGRERRDRRRLRAGAPRHRRPLGAPRRPRPRGARRRQPRLRRRPVEPPVRRDPRASRLAYSVYSATSAYCRRRRLVGVRRGDARARRRGAPAGAGTELDRLVADGITDDELAIAVGYLTGAYEMGLEDTGARMSRLGGMLATLGQVHHRRRAARPLGAR